MVEHLASKMLIFLSRVGGETKTAKKGVNIGLKFIRLSETTLQMNANACLCILNV